MVQSHNPVLRTVQRRHRGHGPGGGPSLSLSFLCLGRDRPNIQDYVVVNHGRMPRRGVYMVGCYPRYMTRPEIRIEEIYLDTGLKNAAEVMVSAHVVAGELDWQVFKRPFNGCMKDSWQVLDTFKIRDAVVYSDNSIETWVRHETHWEVSTTYFVFN